MDRNVNHVNDSNEFNLLRFMIQNHRKQNETKKDLQNCHIFTTRSKLDFLEIVVGQLRHLHYYFIIISLKTS